MAGEYPHGEAVGAGCVDAGTAAHRPVGHAVGRVRCPSRVPRPSPTGRTLSVEFALPLGAMRATAGSLLPMRQVGIWTLFVRIAQFLDTLRGQGVEYLDFGGRESWQFHRVV
jgi:hypothetical protein